MAIKHDRVLVVNPLVLTDEDQITDVMTLGELILHLREAKGWSQDELAVKAGLSQSTIGNIEAGSRGTTKVPASLPYIAQALGVSTDDMLRKTGFFGKSAAMDFTFPDDSITLASEAGPVPVLGMSMTELPDQVVKSAIESRHYAVVGTTDKEAFLVRVDTDSMAPKFEPGDYALVEPGTPIEIEDDVVLRLADGQTLLRRLVSRRDGIKLTSLNPRLSPVTLNDSEVVWMFYVAHPVPAKKIKSVK